MDLVPNEWTQQAAEGMLNRHIPSSRIPTTQMEKPPLLEKSPLRCPRCDSSNTKFCYYNNYSLSQPRHFCKSCKRYWTRGGTLRNVPVGGGCRKNKRIRKPSPITSVPPPNPLSFLPTSSSISPSTELGFLFGNFPSSEMGFPGLQSPYGLNIGDGYLPGLGQISPCPPFQGFGLHQISSSHEMMENRGILGFSGVQHLDVKPMLGISNGRSDWEITSCESADFPLHWSSGALTDSSNSGFPIIPLL